MGQGGGRSQKSSGFEIGAVPFIAVALLIGEYFKERAKRGRRKFAQALSEVRDVEPDKHDRPWMLDCKTGPYLQTNRKDQRLRKRADDIELIM